jgi:hypothetical protein
MLKHSYDILAMGMFPKMYHTTKGIFVTDLLDENYDSKFLLETTSLSMH